MPVEPNHSSTFNCSCASSIILQGEGELLQFLEPMGLIHFPFFVEVVIPSLIWMFQEMVYALDQRVIVGR
jgi:hypothetical protein